MEKKPTFEEWLKKYCHSPRIKKMYKIKLSGNELSEEDLYKKYKKAYSHGNS